MHTTDNMLNERTLYVVHHDGDCTDEAVFTIAMEGEKLQTTGALIEDVTNQVLEAKYAGDDAIRINDIIFFIKGLEPILVSMSASRIESILSNVIHEMPLEDILDLEHDVIRL